MSNNDENDYADIKRYSDDDDDDRRGRSDNDNNNDNCYIIYQNIIKYSIIECNAI
jgi:hypothetical protein